MAIGQRPRGIGAIGLASALAMLAAVGGAGPGIGLGAKPPEVHDPRFRGPGVKHSGGSSPQKRSRRRIPSLKRRLEWDRQAARSR